MELDNKKAELFERTSIPKATAKLSIPTVMATLVMVLYNMADTYFVGMLNDPIQTAAVTLAAPVLLAFNAINNLFGVGASSMMSRSLGKKDYVSVRKTASFAFYSAIFSGLLISLVYITFKTGILKILGVDETTIQETTRYLYWTVTLGACPSILNVVMSNMVRSEGSSMHASIGVISGCVLNMILDPFFVLPQFLNMGASGAGLATLISNTVACSYFIVLNFVQRKTTFVCLNPKEYIPTKEIVHEVFSVGVPSAIQNLLNVTGTVILNNFTAAYGADAVSAMGIAHKIYLVPLYVSMGTAQGIMPLISYNYTSGNANRMKEAVSFVKKITIVVAVATAIILFAFPGTFIGLFMENESVIAHGSHLLRGMSVGIPFLALDFLCVAVFQATGKGKYAFYFAVLRKIVLEIPFIILLDKFFPLYGMGWSQTCAELVLSVVVLYVLEKLLKEIHQKNS